MGNNGNFGFVSANRFRGQVKARLDQKTGRIKIPARYLETFKQSGSKVFITSIPHDNIPTIFEEFDPGNLESLKISCAAILPLEIWYKQFENKYADLEEVDEVMFFANYFGAEAEIDAKGRVMIPNAIREHSNFKEEVMLIGTGNRLQIWDEKEFMKHRLMNYKPKKKIETNDSDK